MNVSLVLRAFTGAGFVFVFSIDKYGCILKPTYHETNIVKIEGRGQRTGREDHFEDMQLTSISTCIHLLAELDQCSIGGA